MRVFAVVINPENKQQDKFEINDTDFIPEENTPIVLKTGNLTSLASVVKVENVLEKVGESADIIINVFVKIFPPEENVN